LTVSLDSSWGPGSFRTRQHEVDGKGLAFVWKVHRSRRNPAQGQPEGLRDLLGRDTVKTALLPVDDEIQPVSGSLHRVVHIHHIGLSLHGMPHPGRRIHQLPVGFVGGAVHLGRQGGDDRGTRRRLHHFQSHSVPSGDLLKVPTQPQHDLVALLLPPLFGNQVHPDVRHMTAVPQIIVADETVEVHGRGRPDGGNEMGHLRNRPQIVLQCPYGPVRGFEGGSLVHVHHDLEFALVVEGKHLEGHQPKCGQ